MVCLRNISVDTLHKGDTDYYYYYYYLLNLDCVHVSRKHQTININLLRGIPF
jgi:hypothetical protein